MILRGEVNFKSDYRTANRDSANLAPNPDSYSEAVIQVYSARAFNWRGAFSVHTWIATKAEDDLEYIVYQVLGWRTYRGLPAVQINKDIPDRNWFDKKPKVILDIRGQKAQDLIEEISNAVDSYPYAKDYVLWPGPNSNSFVSYIGRSVPELQLTMPSNAIGKDFISFSKFFAGAPSGTGYQFSLFGLLGILIAKEEGVEINFLGLVYGVKLKPFKILVPGF